MVVGGVGCRWLSLVVGCWSLVVGTVELVVHDAKSPGSRTPGDLGTHRPVTETRVAKNHPIKLHHELLWKHQVGLHTLVLDALHDMKHWDLMDDCNCGDFLAITTAVLPSWRKRTVHADCGDFRAISTKALSRG